MLQHPSGGEQIVSPQRGPGGAQAMAGHPTIGPVEQDGMHAPFGPAELQQNAPGGHMMGPHGVGGPGGGGGGGGIPASGAVTSACGEPPSDSRPMVIFPELHPANTTAAVIETAAMMRQGRPPPGRIVRARQARRRTLAHAQRAASAASHAGSVAHLHAPRSFGRGCIARGRARLRAPPRAPRLESAQRARRARRSR
jgi:hypothetical protein